MTTPNWHSKVVLDMIADMRERQDFSNLPILADALEDAGYEDADVLAKCREGQPTILAYRIICRVLQGDYLEALTFIDGVVAEMHTGSGWYDDSETDMSYDKLMNAADNYLATGEYVTQHGGQSWQNSLYDNLKQFWDNYEVVTGRQVEDKSYGFFGCSC
jgi:hypothetical protein